MRDEMQAFLDGVEEKVDTTRLPEESVEQYLKRTNDVIMPRVYRITHGYELHFPARVERIYHEFGERGINDIQLAGLIGRPYRAEEAVKAIIKELSELADLPEAQG